MSEVDGINKSFQQTFRVLFGGECEHRIEDLAPWLLRIQYQPMEAKSAISGKNVMLCSDRYPKSAKFISQDEIDFSKEFQLNINEIKDIDSLLNAIDDRAYYAGNKIFGTSKYISDSDTITDCLYIHKSIVCSQSKQLGYCSYVRDGSEYCFGDSIHLKSKYNIRAIGADNITRCFESYLITNSSDMFFTYDCTNCAQAMFSFGLRSKKYCIGNLHLPKGKYFELKKKLVEESRQHINKHKEFYLIYDFPPPKKEGHEALKAKSEAECKGDLKELENAFSLTSKLLLGKPLSPMKKYEKYLTGRTSKISIEKTLFGNTAIKSDYGWYKYVPKERMVSKAESLELAERSIEIGGSEDLDQIMKKIEKIAFFSMDFTEGSCSNNPFTQVAYNSTNTYMAGDATYAKNVAYDTMAFNSEAVFGCFRVIHSKFCIKCHDCFKLSACMEMDSCSYCTNCMFCHNCENLENCMFCFNAKSLRYAIGNVEVGREKYMEIKKKISGQIARQLEATGGLSFDICNLGAKR